MTDDLQELFGKNRDWAAATEAREPGFFTRLLQQQTPQYLWIGCADSRVPANELVGLLPGELFVHRNVANLLVHSDLNALSVIQYAVDALQVRHIIVVGHSNCGGVRAAMENRRAGLVDNWLRHVQDVRDLHDGFLAGLHESLRVDALVELNVLEQARNVCRTTVVGDAWQRGQSVVVHGWVYGLHNGLLEDLQITATSLDDVGLAYDTGLAQLKQRWRQRQAQVVGV
ncbi:carbonate dehydratase [Aquincola sp. S2]|uniref:Carbonic anhydrase n=1 Tax=Pseudaquabacterium terrae TaxID=2732868 RepID=A0ABX2EAI2_9BURK|nr:carbonate dehydratase [Aquabacterium terrae]NRF66079.1 carbonate dehydratase [Aquabacterium terrae]